MSLEFLLIIVAIICLLLATLNVVLFVELKIRGRDTEALKTLHRAANLRHQHLKPMQIAAIASAASQPASQR